MMGLPELPSIPSPEAAAIKLAVEVLKVYLERKDFRDKVLLEVENAGLTRLIEAQRWAADGGDATLGVRDPAQHTLDDPPPAAP